MASRVRALVLIDAFRMGGAETLLALTGFIRRGGCDVALGHLEMAVTLAVPAAARVRARDESSATAWMARLRATYLEAIGDRR